LSTASVSAGEPTEYEAAPLGRRFGAYIVDSALVLVVALAPMAVIPESEPLLFLLFVPSVILALTYRFFADGIFHGAALGKRLFDIYVVDAKTRQPCSPKQALLRMCYQWIHVFALIDGIVLLCDGLQRWGDRTAGTYVLLRHPKTPPVPKELRPVDFAAIRASLKKPEA
jgi:uncharacterized RDD family membrane protein YckC